ncbi:DUF5677 domain-containing protein [Paenibacillus jamilae]|uniref:DUF5677 domain-containing protein n=1 Tax=Paenibacillus jamilae TaxID=114136 RepID=UPI003D2E7BD0
MERDWFYGVLMEAIHENPDIDVNEYEIDSLVSKVIENTLPEAADMLLNDLKIDSGEMLEEHRLIRQEFEARLQRRWSKPINLLEVLLVIGSESGESYYSDIYEELSDENRYLVYALVRIHARACQIVYEIIRLLRSGFADGAMARWRTLHELSALAFFIKKHGNELAIMYLEYEHIEKYYEMIEYKQYAERLGYFEFTEEQIQTVTIIKDDLKKKYGDDYIKNYGWTMKVLPKKARNFKGIEEDIGLDHLRPFYKLACNFIHLGPKAISSSLSLIEGSKVIVAGATNYGLADPGQNAALSLTQITTCLLTTTHPSYDRLVLTKVMSTLTNEISQLFVDVQKQLELEEQQETQS